MECIPRYFRLSSPSVLFTWEDKGTTPPLRESDGYQSTDLNNRTTRQKRAMKVVGAFAREGSEEFFRWATSGIRGFDLVGVGSSADAVSELCKQHQPDVILVGPKFAPELPALHSQLANSDLNQPMLIGTIWEISESRDATAWGANRD